MGWLVRLWGWFVWFSLGILLGILLGLGARTRVAGDDAEGLPEHTFCIELG